MRSRADELLRLAQAEVGLAVALQAERSDDEAADLKAKQKAIRSRMRARFNTSLPSWLRR